MSFSVGLTGGIGSGKSTVAELFRAHGVALIDTDLIAHELTRAGGPALPPIRVEFGAQFIGTDGALDRARMRAHVFASTQARQRLEAILHPLIREAAEEQAARLEPTAPYVMFVVPLLIESPHWRTRVTRVLLIDCSVSTQIERVQKRNAWNQAQARAALAAQATRAQRLQAADDVLVNEADAATLPARVARLHEAYLSLAQVQAHRVTIAPR